MRKIVLPVLTLLVSAFIFLLLTAQKNSGNRKFYYAFNEKIFIEEIPGRYVVKYKDAKKAATITNTIKARLSGKGNIKYQNSATVTIGLIANEKNITQLLKDDMADIELIRPVYSRNKQEIFYTNEIMVEVNAGVTINDVLKKSGLSSYVKVKEEKFFSVVQVAASHDALDAANRIQESGLVKYSHPNFTIRVEKHQVIPNDTYFNNQYYLKNTGQVFNPVEGHAGQPNADINATYAWNYSTGNNSIIVAVLDEGVTPDHPDLPDSRQVRLNGSNFMWGENPADPSPDHNNNHGNACAGIIAATQNNSQGITGIAPNVRIMPIKIFDSLGSTDDNILASAIDFAWENGAHVISNSWGFAGEDGDNPNLVPAIVAAISRAVDQGRGNLGSIVVFSAGNTASHAIGVNGKVCFPSNVEIPGVLTVGASDRYDRQSDYSPISNTASVNNQIIDIVAPSHRSYPPEAHLGGYGGIQGEGFEIWTIDMLGNAGYNRWNDPFFPGVCPAYGEVLPSSGTNYWAYTGRFGGTSAACPQVAAVAALLLSVNIMLTTQQVFDLITQNAEKVGGYAYNSNGWCPEMGFGRLNACAAITAVPDLFPINGPTEVPGGGVAIYKIAGAPAGTDIKWSTSDPSVATISQTGVLTAVRRGPVDIMASFIKFSRCHTLKSVKSVNVIDVKSKSAQPLWTLHKSSIHH